MSLKALSDYTLYAKYSHYLPEKKRRETWPEIVERVFGMHERKFKHILETNPEFREEFEFAKRMVRKKRVLGSQRALQFAGPWIEKENLKLYNCSAMYIDRARAFSESMYLLLCGVGLGFSVQKFHVQKLPNIRPIGDSWRKFKVDDSIEGWADAIGAIVNSYFPKEESQFPELSGHKVNFDYSQIRPEGALIAGQFKAPGPKGLEKAIEKIRQLIEKRLASSDFLTDEFAGKLRPIDCYDIIMFASDAVLSGGIRRSATICMFDLFDKEMMNAKTGNWFIENPQRGRSNNSAVLIKGKTTKEEFSKLMNSTKEFGEPGFIWVEEGENNGTEIVYNPCCVSKDSLISTSKGIRRVEDLIGVPFLATVNGKNYSCLSNGFFKSGTKDLFKLEFNCGLELLVTKDHKILTKNRGWVEAGNLTKSDLVVLNNNRGFSWEGFGNENEGWLVGSLLGDGTFGKNGEAILDYWKDEAEYKSDLSINKIYSENFSNFKKVKEQNCIATIEECHKKRITSSKLALLSEEVGVRSNKEIGDEIFYCSSDFIIGFLRGWFDADGSIQDGIGGKSIRLSSCILENLKKAQVLLLNLGIYSKIYKDRLKSREREFPNDKERIKKCDFGANHELIIPSENMEVFRSVIGFSNRQKKERLDNEISSYSRKTKEFEFLTSLSSFEFYKTEDVYDCTIDDIHAFSANGIYVHNCEIGMIPKTEDGESGIQGCNLTEINGKFCTSEEEFLQCCRASAIIGTMQAAYTKFNYVTEATKKIFEREALLGCSITGFMDHPDILLNEEIQRKGAEEIKKTNIKIAKMIGIRPAARLTCVKPAGTTSCILGTASGIHPHHAKKYIRRVQANRNEFPAQLYKEKNPLAVEPSVWSANGTDEVISFLCEVPRGAIMKNSISAVEFLDAVRKTQENWVEYGTAIENCVKPYVRHNVSVTAVVKTDEWQAVEDFIFKHQKSFAGISLLPASGDLDYQQAPFATVLTPEEIVQEYGDASVFASGLIVDGLHAFDGNLWNACDAALGIGEKIPDEMDEPIMPVKNGCTFKEFNKKLIEFYQKKELYESWFAKKDWIRRLKKFADRYFNSDIRRASYCLKHVSLWKTWVDIQREHVEIDWSQVIEENQNYFNANSLGAQACSGGACNII